MLTVMKPPVAAASYVMGVRPRGRRAPMGVEVIDAQTLEQVAEFDGHVPDSEVAAETVVAIARQYNDALVAPEVAGHSSGREMIVWVKEMLGYDHLYRWHDRHGHETHMLGWESNSRSRPRMLAAIHDVVTRRIAMIHSEALLRQIRGLGEDHRGRWRVLNGPDHLMMAWAIALMVSRIVYPHTEEAVA